MRTVSPVLEVQAVAVKATPKHSAPLALPLDFELTHGQKALLSGPSGCGKTTFLNAIVGLHPLHEGNVVLLGEFNISKTSVSTRQKLLRSDISYVGQELVAFPGLTVKEYLEFNLQVCKKKVSSGLYIGILESLGVEHTVNQMLTDLSKGQLQRVMITGGLIRQPKLLLLDEPSSALDSDSRDSLFSVVDDAVHEGTGVLMVSHDPVVESFVDSVITMEKDDANHE